MLFRSIVNNEKNLKKSISSNELLDEIKDILDDVVNPIDTVIEIPDDEEIQKALRAEVTRDQLYAVVQHLHEAIESMLDDESEDEEDDQESEMPGMEMPETETEAPETEMEDMYKSDNEDEDKWDNAMQKCWTGYKQEGMKDKGGRMVPNCVPVEKMDGQMYISDEERRMMEDMDKDVWKGSFSPDLVKRNFNTKERNRMAEAGTAMPDGSYPIGNKKDLMNAIRSWGRGGSDPKVKAHIKRRAKALGAEDMIPENWK